jgi:hypothetical protein
MQRRRRLDRAGRPAMRLPGRPPVAGREEQQRFWKAVARGLSSEEAAMYGAHDIAAVAATLNRRPRKTLGWRTPSEAFNELLLSHQRGRVATTP